MARKPQHGGKREGAGRKPVAPEEKAITIAVSIHAGLVERLDAVAEQNGWNRSQAVREAVQALVKRK
jgi:hypothetical protein